MTGHPTDAMKLCPFCGECLERFPSMDDGTPVAKHPSSRCALSGLFFSDAQWNTRTTPIADEGLERLVEICAGIADAHDQRGDIGNAIRKLAKRTYQRGLAISGKDGE